jgi:hypothetical protein
MSWQDINTITNNLMSKQSQEAFYLENGDVIQFNI